MENLFLSSDSDVESIGLLDERIANKSIQERAGTLRVLGILLPIIVAGFLIVNINYERDPQLLSIVLTISTATVIYFSRPQKGLNTKIPIEKISSFSLSGNDLNLEFLDAVNDPDSLTLPGFKGAELLKIRSILLGEEVSA